ncbi:MAG: vitamin K epoxide reductase family protein [Acidimicrobiales bacterium]
MDERDLDMPRWPGVVGTTASVLGLGVAGYLTYEHYTSSTSLACSDNGVVNCLKVTTSSYSEVAGVPVAVLGLAFFAVMLVLQLPPTWRRKEPAIRWGRMAWAVVGLGTVLYLFYAELFRIDAICLWCTSVHVLTLILFGSTLLATLTHPPMESGERSVVPTLRGRKPPLSKASE